MDCLFKRIIVMSSVCFSIVLLGETSAAAESELDRLLQSIRTERSEVVTLNRQREQDFLAAKEDQKRLLDEAKKELAKRSSRSSELKSAFEANERALSELENQLAITLGTLGEMFGVVRQVAADAKNQFENSIVTAQFPERVEAVASLSEKKQLPTVDELKMLWFELQREMTESGKVVLFDGTFIAPDGEARDTRILRVGSFNVAADGKFLTYLGSTNQLVELGRQPPRRFRAMANELASANSGMVKFPVDPSRGTILSLLVQAPSLSERIQQGGLVGYVILAILGVGLLLVVERAYSLHAIGRKMREQLTSKEFDATNPLGQVMLAYQGLVSCKDPDALELKLHEAVVKVTPPIERGLSFLKLMAAVAPLLGLLGTVVGMIATFQSITLFGTGDPKLMAGGISQALVTTVFGLVTAIPLLLLHSVLNSKSKGLLQILDEQTAGLIAERAEQEAVV